MPYINQKRRRDIMGVGEAYIDTREIISVGELNFAVTMLCKDYLELKGLKYSTINDIIGVLECAKQEFYQRVAVPYEQDKCMENGDVYNFPLDNDKK